MKRELPAGWVPDGKGGYSKAKGYLTPLITKLTPAELVSLYAQETKVSKPKFTMRKSKSEEKLNKLEYSYLQWLRQANYVSWIGIQNITLKLADDTRYSCDFWTMKGDVLQAREVKGPWFPEDGKIKLKVAAHQFPMFEFWLVRKVDGMWRHELVSP